MSKELYMAAHEAAIERYMEENPEADEEEAYESTSDQAYHDMGDMLAVRIDQYRQQAKDLQL